MDSDINYIIQESLNGDKNCQEILLEKLKPLIYRNIYAAYKPEDLIAEDLVQEGYVVILLALKTFNNEKNVHFLQHAKVCLKYFYKNYYRKHETLKNKSYITKSAMPADFNLMYADENSFDALDYVIKHEELNELTESIKKLKEKERNIIYLYYYKKLTLSQISAFMNIPFQTVATKKRDALKKLKKLLEVQKWKKS